MKKEARRGGVDDVVSAGFGEDVVGHGVMEEAADQGLGQGCFLGEGGEGDGAILGDLAGEVVSVDGAEGEDVGELWCGRSMSVVGWKIETGGGTGFGGEYAEENLGIDAARPQGQSLQGLGGVN